MIRYCKNIEIDKTRWDSALSNSFNKLPFALSWYLDIVSPNWDALIFGDYEEIMPITKRTKFGVSYLNQPPLCPRLGVFSTIKKGDFCVDDYVFVLADKFNIIEIALNERNYLSTKNSDTIEIETKFSQEQRFESSYEDVQAEYSKSHKKNINRFINTSGVDVFTDSSYLKFYRYKEKISKGVFNWGKQDKKVYLAVLKKLSEKGNVEIVYGIDELKSVVGGICLLKYDFNRYSFQTFSTDVGRKKGVVFFLIDKIFKENADKTIDFMGSNIPGIRYRNMGFNCSEIQYFFVKKNRYSSLFKKIKKWIPLHLFNN